MKISNNILLLMVITSSKRKQHIEHALSWIEDQIQANYHLRWQAKPKVLRLKNLKQILFTLSISFKFTHTNGIGKTSMCNS